MLTFYHATSSDRLLSHLLTIIKTQPPSSVFTEEQFMVANHGVERWLSQQLAQHFQVFANYQFFLPEPFFQQLNRKLKKSPTNQSLTQEQLLWQIEALLRDVDREVFAPLQDYLSGDNLPMKRYQLATVLSQLFHAYQQARPELLLAWQQGLRKTQHPAEIWQQALWQKIVTASESENYAPLYQTTIAQLQQAQHGQFRYQLPERLFAFAIPTLPPLALQYLHAVAKHCQVHFYCLAPSITLTAQHPVLASLGQQGRAFWHSVQNLPGLQNLENLNRPILAEQRHTILAHLQSDLARGVGSDSTTALQRDDSISIHACHSRMREVEVVKNQLVDSLEKRPALQLHEMVIVAPNIQDYAPYLHAVFTDIPHSIASQHLQLGHEVCAAFIQFLKLCDSRFGWQTVMDLLEQPSIYPSFDLSTDDLDLLKYWLNQTQIRWGQSAQHKRQFALPPLHENTWQASLERLLMGYAVNQEDDFVAGVLPYPHLEGSSAQALGGLCDFIHLLFAASHQLQQVHTLQAWSEQFAQYSERLFAKVSPSEQHILQNLMADLAEKFAPIHQQTLELKVITRWLDQQLASQTSASGLLRGQLTCCSLAAVRGIPFQVIALLGMNEGEFPRLQKPTTFDLIAQYPRAGDFSQRADDRQQFLELLFAARQQLIITYIGQSLAQNQTLPPAVVVSELVEVLENDYLLQNLVIKQPLQAFSRHYFTGENPQLLNYSKTDCATALALASEKPLKSLWWQGTIQPKIEQVIELIELFSFYRQPQRYFLRRQLALSLQPLAATPSEREPFSVEGLEAYAIYQDWIEALLNEQPFSLEKLQAQGQWLSGVMAKLEFAQRQSQLVEFVSKIKGLNLGIKIEPLAVDSECGQWRLIGKLEHRYQQGSLFYRFAPLKGKDFFIALLHHVLVNQQQPETTHLLSTDQHLVFAPELSSSVLLGQLIDLYVKGQQQPAALFTESVLDYVKQASLLKNSTRATKSAWDAASEKWRLALEQPHQLELKRLFSGIAETREVLNAEFVELCEDIILPIWEGCLRA
jgi:exodeoxyribonuclease V gamma subunit